MSVSEGDADTKKMIQECLSGHKLIEAEEKPINQEQTKVQPENDDENQAEIDKDLNNSSVSESVDIAESDKIQVRTENKNLPDNQIKPVVTLRLGCTEVL